MAMEYSKKVMEHFARPHNVGTIEDANGVGEVGNAKCGDIMRMYLKINDEEIIEDVKFQTFTAGRPSRASTTALLVRFRASLRGLPLIISVAIELVAMADAQPKVWNFTSSMTSSSLIFRYMRMISPHLALPI